MAENYLRPRRGGLGGQGYYEEFDSDTEENEYYENEDYEDGELDPVERENLLEMEGDSDEEEAEAPDSPDLEDAPPDAPPDAPFNLEDLGNFPHLAEDLELVHANDAGLFFII